MTIVDYLVTDARVGDPADRFFDRLAEVFDTLADRGTIFEVVERSETDNHIRVSWMDFRSGAAVRMWDDRRVSVRYLELRAADVQQLGELRVCLAAGLGLPTRASVIARARAAPGDPAAIMRTAYAAGPRADDQTISIVEAALQHPSAGVRDVGAYAAGVLAWPELRPALKAQLAREDDPAVTTSLRRAISMLGA